MKNFFFDFTLAQQIRETERLLGLQNSKQWSTLEWINYRLTQKLSIGAGLGGGYSQAEFGSDSTYEQLQGRLNWNPSSKLSVNINGGAEVRQFLDSPDSENLVNPLMGVAIAYQVLEQTSLALSANRSVSTSIFRNRLSETTSLIAGLDQRFLKRFQVGLSGGYTTSNYKDITSGVTNGFLEVDRSDDSTFVAATIGTSLWKRGHVSLDYRHSQNDSSSGGFTYASDQYTASIGYRF